MKILAALLLLTSVSLAHHGPKKPLHHDKEHKIEAITKKIGEKASPLLYFERAKLHIEVGKKKAAIHDLEHALMLDKNYKPAKDLLQKLKKSL